MDFGSLLYAAQRNEHKAKREPKKCYVTTFSAPKKEQKDTKSLSANIQKFLARKDEEEKEKEKEAKRIRDDLLTLRSQDGKAKKRVAAMLKRTKAANKSAIQDAVDDDNTAVTLDGPSQPDEDDYGYVSQEASAYYNKLMDKYNSTPAEEPLFSQKKKAVYKDLNSTKDRVRMALLKEEEEEMMPHKRRRRSKSKKEDDPGDTTLDYHSSDLTDIGPSKEAEMDSDEELERQSVASKPKIKKPGAPPLMNFHDLLKLAEKKQFEPVKIEPKKKPEDEDRPMTKKQKVEFRKEQEWRQRKEEAAKGGQAPSNPNQPPRIPKLSRKDDPAQNQKSSSTDRGQERSSGMGQQMKIPKLNNLKREEKTITYSREEERPSSFRREERPTNVMKRAENVGPPRQNGSLNRENSYSAPLKASASAKDNKVMKKIPKDTEVVLKKQKLYNENNSFRKPQVPEERERSKGIQNDNHNPSSNALRRLPLKISEGKQNSDNVSIIKNSSNSGYDKKLQEAIMAKMQESQKKKRMEESASSKPVGKSCSRNDSTPKVSKDIERSSLSFKSQGKLPSKLDRPVEQKSNFMNQKVNSTSSNRPSQEWNPQSRPSTVPSTKPRVPPCEAKSKPVPSLTSKPLSSGDMRSKQTPQTSGYGKPTATSDGRSKLMPPPETRPKQLPSPGMRPKQVHSSEARPKQLPPPEVKPKQFPPPDVKSRQFPPADVRSRQFPPPDVQRKQFPPPDVRRNPKPPLKRRITDSEDEYDPEMDDFIDDGPEEEEDYSQHIREIFGYDRRKYSRIDDDNDECMESNFATILKEDFISTKTGILEDLEDIRREKEMEKRKKLAKKKKL